MAKLFEIVKKGSTLMLNGKFINYEGAVVVKVTLTERHGNCIRITYRGLCENTFTHTITVDKDSDSYRVMVHEHKWRNYNWGHLLWLKKWNSLKRPLEYYAATEESGREFREQSELRYDYDVTIL
jgi:hypothetical protein